MFIYWNPVCLGIKFISEPCLSKNIIYLEFYLFGNPIYHGALFIGLYILELCILQPFYSRTCLISGICMLISFALEKTRITCILFNNRNFNNCATFTIICIKKLSMLSSLQHSQNIIRERVYKIIILNYVDTFANTYKPEF